MAFCGRQLYYCFAFVLFVLFLHTTKSWCGDFFFFVTKMRMQRDDDVRRRRLFFRKRCRRGVRRSTERCKMVLLISPCPIGRWGWRMVMLDNKLNLIRVAEFLCRSSVDRGTREGKVVVGTDLSKRKPSQYNPAFHPKEP